MVWNIQLPEPFRRSLSDLRAQSKLAVQEHYTAVFDLNPDTSLNFTYHLIGDGEERGRALADIQELYRRAGFETAVNELPDFLPLVFEFLSESPEGSSPPALRRLGVAVAAIAKRLEETRSIYAGLLILASGLVPAEDSAQLAPEAVSAPESNSRNGQPAWSERMNTLDYFFFVAFPYLCLTTFTLGHAYRYVTDRFAWNAHSSELIEKGRLLPARIPVSFRDYRNLLRTSRGTGNSAGGL